MNLLTKNPFRPSFIWKIGLTLLQVIVVIALAHGSAEAEKAPRIRQSLLDYQPSATQFQPALTSLVEQMQSGCSSAQKTSCSKIISLIRKKRAVLSRGYHDELWFLEGFAQEQLGEQKKALSAYESSLKLGIGNPKTIFRKALVLESLSRFDDAIKTMREFLWISTTNQYEAKFVIGRSLCALKLCDKGLLEVEAALASHPRFISALQFLVDKKREKLERLKDPTKKAELEAQIATDLFHLVQLQPHNREATLSLARYSMLHSDPLVHAHKLNEAERMTRRLVDGSGYKDSEAVRLLFDIHLRRGKTQAASAVLSKGLEVAPKAKPLQAAKRQLEIQQIVDEQVKQKAAEELEEE